MRSFVVATFVALLTVATVIACRDDEARPDAPAMPEASLPITGDASDAGDVDLPVPPAPRPCEPEERPAQAVDWGAVIKPRDECDFTDLEYTLRCLFGDPLMALDTCNELAHGARWPRCTACLFGEDGKTLNDEDGGWWATPLVVHKGIARVNIAGCLAVAYDDAGLVGCVGDWYGLEQCRATACEKCTETPDRYESCRAIARDRPTCGVHRVSAQCALEADDAGCGYGNDFLGQAIAVGRRFCAPRLDGGPFDAAAD